MSAVNRAWIVDDDDIYRFIMRKQISTLEFSDKIELFPNGKEAIDELLKRVSNKEDLPEVIFLDINMPIMSGWDFMKEFNKHKLDAHGIQIYMVSSSVDNKDMSLAEKMPAIIKYIVKPMQSQTIKDLMVIKAA